MSLPAGAKLGPYEIVAPLGAGGMGEVYRARDTRLDRDVAIKVLREEFFEDKERRARFEREAKALAAVNHPNIAAIHSFEEISGRFLLVQEFLEGESLRFLIERGPIPLKKSLDVAGQVAEGLAAAHAKGIVHRDLKPENVFLTKDGHPKILDFGLARHDITRRDSSDTRSPTLDALSERGVLLGTVAYMSPEQVRGEPVDHRSDQFALGILLYEMIAGRKPFRGGSTPEILASIIRDEPEPLEEEARNVPAPVRWIVERCLSKERAERYESTRDLAKEIATCRSHLLEAGSGVAVSAPAGMVRFRPPAVLGVVAGVLLIALIAAFLARQKTTPIPASDEGKSKPPLRIVVLPFENLGSPDDAYFASGMTEEITSRLANVRTLAVISRTTATQYDRKGKTVDQIGKDLGVGYVLEGSVRWDRSGGGPGRVRITPQLIRVSGDTHFWADHYDRQLADIFAIQGDVADGVVRALNLTLAPAESMALRQLPTRDLEAYDLYLRALELDKRNLEPSALAQQIKLTSQAVERDPQFAEALAQLARVRIMNYWLYYDRRESELERARVEAERAVALRPDAAETHLALGYYHFQGRLDYDAALAEFDKALAIHPNNALVHTAIGYVRRRQGRMDEAEAELRKAVDGDPRNGTMSLELGTTELLLRKYPDALRSFEVSTSINPTLADTYYYCAWANVLWNGDVASAQLVLQRTAGFPNLEDPYGRVDYCFVRISLIARDWEEALRRLNSQRREAMDAQGSYVPLSLLRAEVLSYMVRPEQSREFYEVARRALASKIREAPDDARLHSSLGIALAGLGRNAEAVQEGERGVDLMPPARDSYRGVSRVEDLARIYTMVGNHEAAIQQLDYLLSHPSWISVTLLKLDPRWDPLRKNPKFEALLARYEVKR